MNDFNTVLGAYKDGKRVGFVFGFFTAMFIVGLAVNIANMLAE